MDGATPLSRGSLGEWELAMALMEINTCIRRHVRGRAYLMCVHDCAGWENACKKCEAPGTNEEKHVRLDFSS